MQTTDDKGIKVALKLTPEEHLAAKMRLLERRTNFQKVLYALFSDWLQNSAENSAESANNRDNMPQYSESEARAIQALVAMMRANDAAWPVVEFALQQYMEDRRNGRAVIRR